ncbi:glycerol transporter [Saitoella coloradoensis]
MHLFSIEALEPEIANKAKAKKDAIGLSTIGVDAQPRGKGETTPSPSRWKTPEFYLYYAAHAVVVPMMFKCAYDLSKDTHPNYPQYENLLEPGWIPGLKVDNSDVQYSDFRDRIPILFSVLVGYTALRRLYDRTYNLSTLSQSIRAQRRVLFDVGFALLFITALHGFSAVKILLLLGINYGIAKAFKGNMSNPVLTWAFNIIVLFLNERYGGYRFQDVHESGALLDAYPGLLSRWQVHFNITALRLISFNMDYYWSFSKGPSLAARLKKDKANADTLTERERIEAPCERGDYGWLNYLGYTLYVPLYLAGPIITFNNYMSQIHLPSPTISPRRTLLYAIRLLISILTMEFLLHNLYVVAIAKSHAWSGLTPFQLSMVSYWNLKIVWLKLLIPWRFFRLWAMWDGIETSENVLRCMSNVYSAKTFWRAWHRSFNRWIVRYIYVPLGGSRLPIVNTLAVFTFVALWHDISLRLLAWGWLATLFILPELIASAILSPKKWGSWPWYRHLCALGGVFNMFMMVCANLVGFVIGLDGLKEMLVGILGSYYGLAFVVITVACLFCAVQIMFETREDEQRRGIFLRC